MSIVLAAGLATAAPAAAATPVITNYPGNGISGPTAITPGPQGALWFANLSSNTIGRITPSGKVTDFASPAIDVPGGIAAGADGNLWFTNFGLAPSSG